MLDLSHAILPPRYGTVLLTGAARSGVHFLGLQVTAEFAAHDGRAIVLTEYEADAANILDRLNAYALHRGITTPLDVRFVVDPRSYRASDYALAVKPAFPSGATPALIVRDVSRSLVPFDAGADPFLPLAHDLVRSVRAYVLTVAATYRPVPLHCTDAIHELTLPPGTSDTTRLELHQRKPNGREPITLTARTLPQTVVFDVAEHQPAAPRTYEPPTLVGADHA